MMVVPPAVWPLLRAARSQAPSARSQPCDTGCAPKQACSAARQPLQWPALQAEGRVSSPSLLRVGPEEEAAVGTPRRLRRRWLRDLRRCCSGLCDWSGCSLGPGRLCRSLGPGCYAAPQAAPVYGAGQHTYQPAKPAATIASVPAEMTPAIAGDEAPPAPEVKETSGLLLPAPSGN